MLDFQQKKKLRKTLYSRGMLVMLSIVTIFLGNAAWNVFQKYREARENRELAAQELQKLEERESGLSADIERLSTERGVEEELRKRFGVAKEGEEVIVVVDPPAPEGGGESGESTSRGLWQRFLGIFR